MEDYTEDNLMAVLSDAVRRSALHKAMRKEQGSHLPLSNHYYELAHVCVATPGQLHEVVKALLAYRGRYRELLRPLVFHPDIADETLLLLLEKRCCLDALGHRSGPQILLERIASRYRYSEAITTLALRYYSQPEHPTHMFSDFLREHADDAMLRHNVMNLSISSTGRAMTLSPDKQEAIRRIFALPDESGPE